MSKTAGIPTLYAGTTFRSRTEARWAAFFDILSWQWEYEPFDGIGYVPDFMLIGDRSVVVEVKPDGTVADMARHVDKIEHGLDGEWHGDVLIVGSTPLPAPGDNTFVHSHPSIGLFGEFMDEYDGDGKIWSWEDGFWMECLTCRTPAFGHSYQSYGGRPCGCERGGDHHIGKIRQAWIEEQWSLTRDITQWHPGPKKANFGAAAKVIHTDWMAQG